MASNSSSNGIGFGTLLFLTFLVLKLTHIIDWSWWWITAPLWGVFAIILIVAIFYIAFISIYDNKTEK